MTADRETTNRIPEQGSAVEFAAVRRDDQALTELVSGLRGPAGRQDDPADPALAALAALWDDLDDGLPADLDAPDTGSAPAVSLPFQPRGDGLRAAVSLPRDEVPAVSLPADEPASTDALAAGRARRGTRRLGARSVAVAAALAAVASMGGVAAASVAGRGSPLWGLHEALLGTDSSADAAREVRADLDSAAQALGARNSHAAAAALDRAAVGLSVVGTRNGLGYLRGRLADLQRRLAALDAEMSAAAQSVVVGPSATEQVSPDRTSAVPPATEPVPDAKSAQADAAKDSGKDGGRHAPQPRLTGSRGDGRTSDSKGGTDSRGGADSRGGTDSRDGTESKVGADSRDGTDVKSGADIKGPKDGGSSSGPTGTGEHRSAPRPSSSSRD
ncbi:MAG: hypothetical protein M3Z02_06270 [Actinomycetota bacterium]|nr:hypothetical protein [Actinomycetota bacterium]